MKIVPSLITNKATTTSETYATEPKKNMACYISRLPKDTLITIFCKLPIKPLTCCRYVCKSWQEILTDPNFHHSTNLFLCLQRDGNLYWLEFQEQTGCSMLAPEVRWRDFQPHLYPNFDFPKFVFLNSCKGFLCVCQYYDTMHVMNPLTREYINLPPSKNRKGRLNPNLCGIGFDPKTEKLKVVRVVILRSKRELKAEVCTVGTGTWRSTCGSPYPEFSCDSLRAFVNGSLHGFVWWGLDEGICAFDFQTEEFRTLSLPPVFANSHRDKEDYVSLGVFRDSLTFCFSDITNIDFVQVWLMKDYGVLESWTKIVTMRNTLNFDIYHFEEFQDLQLLESGYILWYLYPHLLLYDPKSRDYKQLDPQIQLIIRPIVHTPTFTSLKDLVRDNSRVLSEREDSTKLKMKRWISPLEVCFLLSIFHVVCLILN